MTRKDRRKWGPDPVRYHQGGGGQQNATVTETNSEPTTSQRQKCGVMHPGWNLKRSTSPNVLMAVIVVIANAIKIPRPRCGAVAAPPTEVSEWPLRTPGTLTWRMTSRCRATRQRPRPRGMPRRTFTRSRCPQRAVVLGRACRMARLASLDPFGQPCPPRHRHPS